MGHSAMTTDAEYVKIADKAWHEALEIAKSKDGWKVEKDDKELGDLVESCRNSSGRKIYRCKATISIPPKLLIAALTDTDKVTSWNHTLTEELCDGRMQCGVQGWSSWGQDSQG